MHEAINVRVTEHLLQQNLLGATRSEEHLKTQSNVLKEQKLYKADKKNEITTLETENEILKRRIIESN